MELQQQDIVVDHWTLRLLPPRWRPYGRLMRLDRPIGWWLLLFPCWWGLALAWATNAGKVSVAWLLATAALFLFGAVVMRGAGCVINDLWDRDFDGQVARTRTRPIPAGEVSPRQALLFCLLLLAGGLLVLLWLNRAAQLVALASLGLVVLYPLAKRFSNWPQLVLGLAFNWGALVGWLAVTGRFHPAMLALYVAGIAWTLGYDTVYAHQDKEDDALIGVRSTALTFGRNSKRWLASFLLLMLAAFLLAGSLVTAAPGYFLSVLLAGLVFAWQLWRVDLDQPAQCLALFKAQVAIGWLVLIGCLLA